MWWNVQNAYDTIHNHHTPDPDVDDEDDEDDNIFYPSSFHTVLEDEDLILMQYTGLKDKNGKEIYEGDVVRVCFQMFPDDESDYHNETIRDIRKIPHLTGSSRTCEVIGNIYENPELLEVK
jgi:hypothetical protein